MIPFLFIASAHLCFIDWPHVLVYKHKLQLHQNGIIDKVESVLFCICVQLNCIHELLVNELGFRIPYVSSGSRQSALQMSFVKLSKPHRRERQWVTCCRAHRYLVVQPEVWMSRNTGHMSKGLLDTGLACLLHELLRQKTLGTVPDDLHWWSAGGDHCQRTWADSLDSIFGRHCSW